MLSAAHWCLNYPSIVIHHHLLVKDYLCIITVFPFSWHCLDFFLMFGCTYNMWLSVNSLMNCCTVTFSRFDGCIFHMLLVIVNSILVFLMSTKNQIYSTTMYCIDCEKNPTIYQMTVRYWTSCMFSIIFSLWFNAIPVTFRGKLKGNV